MPIVMQCGGKPQICTHMVYDTLFYSTQNIGWQVHGRTQIAKHSGIHMFPIYNIHPGKTALNGMILRRLTNILLILLA